MPVMDDVKELVDSVKSIGENGATIAQNVTQNMNTTAQITGDATLEEGCTYIATPYMSHTVRLVWTITIFSMVLFIATMLSDVFFHVNVSYVLTYDIGVWVPMLITYCTKSYLEKKHNIIGAETIINPIVSPVEEVK